MMWTLLGTGGGEVSITIYRRGREVSITIYLYNLILLQGGPRDVDLTGDGTGREVSITIYRRGRG